VVIAAKRGVALTGTVLAVSLLSAGMSWAQSAPGLLGNQVLNAPGGPAATRYVPGQLLVGYRPAGDAVQTNFAVRSRLVSTVGAVVVRRSLALRMDVVHVVPGDERLAISLLRANPLVAYAERDAIVPAAEAPCASDPACWVPNDPLFKRQWGLSNDTLTIAPSAGAVFGADIAAPAAWQHARSNRSVRIAVIDSGIEATHQDLSDKVVFSSTLPANNGNATDLSGHGTAVAGVAAAIPDNGIGIAGSGYNASLMNIKATDDAGDPSHPAITGGAEADAILLATANGANIINISYAGYVDLQAVRDAVSYAWSHGVLIVAAAGNDNTAVPTYPAAYPHVIAVAATDNTDRRASFSNANASWVQLAAPGVGIVTTTPDYRNAFGPQGYAYVNGTSFSAPFVAGVAALLWPIVQDGNGDGHINDEVAQRLFSSADRIPGTGTYWSRGRVDACRAVTQRTTPCPALGQSRPALPRLRGSIAERYINVTLTDRFGIVFSRRKRSVTSCARKSRTRLACRTAWYHGGYYYQGRVVVFYGLRRDIGHPYSRFVVKRINARCSAARPRRNCAITVYT
jgi:thermitase